MPKSVQRRRKHCALAVVRRSQKNVALPQTPFPGAQDGQNLISWRWSLPYPTDPVWWRLMHASSSYRGNRPTKNKQTDRGDHNTLQRSLAHSVIISTAWEHGQQNSYDWQYDTNSSSYPVLVFKVLRLSRTPG